MPDPGQEARLWPASGGEMAARIRAHGWSATPLGPLASWPQSLRSAIDLMLATRTPVAIAWGPDLCLFYNDAQIPLLGRKHGAALGRPWPVVFPESWHEHRPIVQAALEGEAGCLPDRPLPPIGWASRPSRWFTLSWTPLRDEAGNIAGVYCTASETTALRRAGVALRRGENRAVGEHEEHLAAIFAHASVGLSVIGLDGTFRQVNDELCRILARPAEALLRLGVVDVTHPDDIPPSLEAVARTVRTGRPSSLDKRYRRPDGSLVWASSTVTRLQDAQGEPGNLLVVTIDLTARREAEERLRQSEERLRLIVENARDYAILVTDPQGLVTDWLPGAATAFGWSADEIIGRPADILFTAEDRAVRTPEREMEAARDTGSASNVRWHQRKDGTRVFLDGRTVALRHPDGTLRGFLKIGQDVTERRGAEDQLARSEALFRTLATGIQQLVFLCDRTGASNWNSPQWGDYTGQDARQTQGFGWMEAIHPDDREETRRRWANAAASGSLYVEHRIRRADGAYRWHQTRARPLDPADGAASEWVGASTDVHHLRELQDVQSVLVAELQHRTRNLIGVVRSLAESTLAGSASMEDFRGRFSDRLGALARVQGLLARQETGQRVTFGELIRTSLSGLGAIDDEERGAQVTLEGPRGVRLRSGTVQTLALALHELGTNALKYGALSVPGGHLAIVWRIERAAGGAQRLLIDWRESGVEIPPLPAEARPRRGYGRELIERALPYQLQAETDYRIGQDGVRCTISLPISPRQDEPAED